MKKLLKFCTIGGMALVIAACGNGEEETDTGDEAVTEETETAEEGTEDTASEEEEGAETESEDNAAEEETGSESEEPTEEDSNPGLNLKRAQKKQRRMNLRLKRLMKRMQVRMPQPVRSSQKLSFLKKKGLLTNLSITI